MTDADGNIAEYDGFEQRFAYDPWGNRRDPDYWENADTRTSWLTDRGYTMHEHLTDFALINMNGRVYDPLISRFLSPDPQLQSPGNWLNYNRYAYCLNNPVMYTDPDGENPLIIAAAIVIDAYMGGSAVNDSYNPGKWDYSSAKTYGGIVVGGVSGWLGGGISTGAIGGLSGFNAAVTGGMVAGAINGGGMTAVNGGNGWDVLGGVVQGGVIGGFSAAAGYGMYNFSSGITDNLINDMPWIAHNTIDYMASYAASQMTSNVLSGNSPFANFDNIYKNPMIALPIFADLAPRLGSLSLKTINENQSQHKDYSIDSKTNWCSRSMENGDLNIESIVTGTKNRPAHQITINTFSRFVNRIKRHFGYYAPRLPSTQWVIPAALHTWWYESTPYIRNYRQMVTYHQFNY